MNAVWRDLCIAGFFVAIVFVFSLVAERAFSGDALSRFADRVMRECTGAQYPVACFDEAIPRLMDESLSMEDAFQVTRIIQGKRPDYFYCHVLGHRLAEKETAKDPSQWTEVVARCPTGICSNGCIHGAAQERYRKESLSPPEVQLALAELTDTCESGAGKRVFTGVEQASCYHALGHLAMFITGGDVPSSLSACDTVAYKDVENDYVELCYEGVFMQVFQPLEPEDTALIQGFAPETVVEAEAFCGAFTGMARAACYRESWPLQRDTLFSASGLNRFCALVPGAEAVKRCYDSLFYVLIPQLGFTQSSIVPFCDGFDAKRQAQCYAKAASRLIETDATLVPDALGLCVVAEEKGAGKRCYNELLFYSSVIFREGSEPFKSLCAGLPEPWKGACFAGDADIVDLASYDL